MRLLFSSFHNYLDGSNGASITSVGTVGSWNEPRVHCTKIYYPGNSRINRMVSCLELED